MGIQFTIGHRGGGSKTVDVSAQDAERILDKLLRELHEAEDEHYQVYVNTPTGRSLTALDGGLLNLNDESGDRYYRPETHEEAVKILMAVVGFGGAELLDRFTREIPALGPGLSYVLKAMGEHALHQASHAGSTFQVEKLLEAGHDPNRPDEHGQPPLLLAAIEGHTRVCRLLIEAGADPTVRDEDGNGLLRLAEDYPATVALLREAGARE